MSIIQKSDKLELANLIKNDVEQLGVLMQKEMDISINDICRVLSYSNGYSRLTFINKITKNLFFKIAHMYYIIKVYIIDRRAFTLDVDGFCNYIKDDQYYKLAAVYKLQPTNVSKTSIEYINSLQLVSPEPVPEKTVIDDFVQDVFETEEEFTRRIANMPARKIGKALLKKEYIDSVSNIAFLRYHMDKVKKATVDDFDAIYADLKYVKDFEEISGDIVAKLVVVEGKVYVDYRTAELQLEDFSYPLVVFKWQKFVFETEEEYEQRIANMPAMPLGKAIPIRKEYKLKEKILPFSVVPYDFAKTIVTETSYEFRVPVEDAIAACEEKAAATLYGKIDKNFKLKGRFLDYYGKHKIGQIKTDISAIKKCSVGDYIKFGKFAYNSIKDIRDIEWKVLSVLKDRALIISRFGLDTMCFDKQSNKWADSSIRKWLNGKFLEDGFNEEEKNAIIEYNTEKDYIDNVFLLSAEEAKQYFIYDSHRECQAAPYAISKGVRLSDWGTSAWWLRSSGTTNETVADIGFGGDVSLFGYYHYKAESVVRPAMWVRIEQ